MVSKLAKKPATSQRQKWLKILAKDAPNSEAGSHKVLIDTNVWISALLYGGEPERLIRLCKQHHKIVVSEYIVDELLDYLKQIGAPYKWRNSLEKMIKQICLLVEPEDLPVISRDIKDDPVIAAAIVGDCDYLITGDKDLLVLKHVQQIRVVTPNEFLEIFQSWTLETRNT